MEQNRNRIAPEAPADEPASSFNPSEGTRHPAPPDPPNFEPPPLLSDCLDESLDDALAETFPADGRKPRHDGWTPEAVSGFLRHLAATGIVEHAARAVGLSAQSAYAFRNRRQGRAFARMWDALLIHRARARVASELQARAIAGCVSLRKRDGIVVGEYHYYDNRLAMALLTRLDRLAEREAPSDAHLRALSEDLDDYLDCLTGGGDADAFVAARRPVEEPLSEAASACPPKPDSDPELTTFAHLSGCSSYLDVEPRDIEVRDLDLSATNEWSPDQWVRAFRSGFMIWAQIGKDEPGFRPGPGTAMCYYVSRAAACAAAKAAAETDGGERGEAADIDISDLDTAAIWDWTDDQLVRAWRSRLLQRLPMEFWDDLAASEADGGEEE